MEAKKNESGRKNRRKSKRNVLELKPAIKEQAMGLAEIDAQIKELEKQKREALKVERNRDLLVVKDLVKKHSFTNRMLKDSLGTGRIRRSKEEIQKSA